MDQKITIKIAGRPYVLKASTPEHEQLIRLAAEDVNKKLARLSSSFPGRTPEDILTFLALNECISRIAFGKINEAAEKEAAELVAETVAYIAEAKKK